ncbi:MAG: helix-turn-helix transcriptional regulator [Planctomycetota bacterium]|nr:MAG: helix-turn-helix transcriptional regulator [Planctomycetota bacterium]
MSRSGSTAGACGWHGPPDRSRHAPARRSCGSRLEQGFADQSHFSRAFRSVYGCTPLAFRKGLGREPE